MLGSVDSFLEKVVGRREVQVVLNASWTILSPKSVLWAVCRGDPTWVCPASVLLCPSPAGGRGKVGLLLVSLSSRVCVPVVRSKQRLDQRGSLIGAGDSLRAQS